MTAKPRSSRRPLPVSHPPLTLIWVIDDGLSHLQRAERTFNAIQAPDVVLECWEDGLKAAGVFERRLEIADRAGLPHIVLMDYFLGGELTGYDIAKRMLAAFQSRPRSLQRQPRPIIVGHSSVPDCSAHIVSLSKDFSLEKRGGGDLSPAILAAFDTPEKRAYILTHRRPRSS